MQQLTSNFQAILWDNDGTLVDTERFFLRATSQILAAMGVNVTMDYLIKRTINKGLSPFVLAEQAGYSAADITEFRAKRNDIYHQMLLAEEVQIIPGVKDVLTRLHGHIPMAIVTSSFPTMFDLIMQKTGLGQFFDFFITSGDVSEIKPSPEAYLLAAERYNLNPQACLAIEDTERGLLAAKAAGMSCYVVPNHLSKKGDFSSADRILNTAADILA